MSVGGKIAKEVSRQEEHKQDPNVQSLSIADVDAFNSYQRENGIENHKKNNSKFKEEVQSLLNLISFPIQRNELIEKIKSTVTSAALTTFLENIPNKKYEKKEDILKIIGE